MEKAFDILLLTEERYLAPKHLTPYIQNVLEEDQLVTEALTRRGLRVKRVNWADPTVNWSDTGLALFRTTWDYFDRFSAFQTWMRSVEQLTRTINPVETIRWNMDKHYLRDLKNKGVNIPETIFMEANDARSLKDLQEACGWEEMILKPCVSGAAKNTFRMKADSLSDYESRYRNLNRSEAFMLQSFQRSVLEIGELSLIVIGGTYTHAVRKVAKAGDFRVQDDWGGSIYPYEPAQDEIGFAERAIGAVDPLPAYARVDIIRDNHGNLAIMELELIEPEMWFRMKPEAADLLGEVVKQTLENENRK